MMAQPKISSLQISKESERVRRAAAAPGRRRLTGAMS